MITNLLRMKEALRLTSGTPTVTIKDISGEDVTMSVATGALTTSTVFLFPIVYAVGGVPTCVSPTYGSSGIGSSGPTYDYAGAKESTNANLFIALGSSNVSAPDNISNLLNPIDSTKVQQSLSVTRTVTSDGKLVMAIGITANEDITVGEIGIFTRMRGSGTVHDFLIDRIALPSLLSVPAGHTVVVSIAEK